MARTSRFAATRGDLLSMIGKAQLEHGKAPTVRALAERFEVGVATMHSYLQKMAEEGVIEWRAGRHRSLKVTPKGFQELS